MKYVDAFHAKTHLSELLRDAEMGYSFTIRRRGKPVAQLVPAAAKPKPEGKELIEEFREIRRRIKGKFRLRELIEEGRKR